MERRSWPWKKKSFDKATTEKAAEKAVTGQQPNSAGASLASVGSQSIQDNYKKPNYVQISVESYSHLTGLENQLRTYEEQVKSYEVQFQTLEDQISELNEKLSEAQTENTTKESLVKQHAKVAEEAVSGWEKAEAEALALKNHLESVTLQKLTAEDRASHLDGALKECMRQIRNLKEEHEQKLHDVVLSKTRQWDKIKHELEAKMANLDQELLRSASDNAALSRSLQERSNMLVKMSEEKSQAEAEIELLKSNIESCEREINSHKYELHIISKELEIRNEEKNMSMRSAEAANKQHLEGVKKIAKLEAECQRLRGLVRKKLPGPAALAQMKLEVENLGRDYGETRMKRSPVKPPSPHLPTLPEFSLDNLQKFHKENEFLTERLLTMEEETKMLKEALAKRNSELQASRNLCAKTANKLQTLESQLQVSDQQKHPLKSQLASSPSVTSMSEDGHDDVGSCAESWATTSISEFSHFKKEKNSKYSKSESACNLELMDDFLEMEKLACSSNESNGAPESSNHKVSESVNQDALVETTMDKDLHPEQQCDMNPEANQVSSNVELSSHKSDLDTDQLPLTKLQSRISLVFESLSKESDMKKILVDIKRVLQDAHNNLHQHSSSSDFEEIHCSDSTCDRQACPEDAGVTAEKEISLSQDSTPVKETVPIISQELSAAISHIHDFVLFLGKEAIAFQDPSPGGNGLNEKIEEFSATFSKVLHNNISLDDFVLSLSHVMSKANELSFNILGYKATDAEINSSDCIDKVALPENKVVQEDSSGGRYPNGCSHISDSTSDPEVPHDENLVPSFELNTTTCKCSLEEFEQLKSVKDNLALDLVRCTENLESTKSQLQETEQHLAEVKSQLTSSQRSNSLSETQLKCMAESYRSLETRAEELESKVNLLRARAETLETVLEEEKKSHQDALARCNDLQEELRRNESCSASLAADIELKNKQEKELAAAAEKLAECQETIFLLGRQFNAMRPPTELVGSPYSEMAQKGEGYSENEPKDDEAEMDSAGALVLYNSPFTPSDTESNPLLKSPLSTKHPKHRPTGSGSSSSAPTPEKQRGFSRFFSTKGKVGGH